MNKEKEYKINSQYFKRIRHIYNNPIALGSRNTNQVDMTLSIQMGVSNNKQ